MTSDPHFGHARIIEYTNRPFADVEEMNEALVARWNAVVAPGDEVWVLGDVALGKLDESLAHIGRLAGTKVLVPGNHDRCWVGQRKGADESRARYLDAGFAQIIDTPERMDVAGHLVNVSHFPYRGDSRQVERHLEHRPTDYGSWLLHGHVHNVWRQRARMINVGVDAWAGAPVSMETIAELITAGARDLDPLPW